MGEDRADTSNPLWRKDTAAEDWVMRFTVGDDYRWDTYLLPYDVRATRAHAGGLARIGLLSADELQSVESVLDDLEAKFADGQITIRPEDEDSHTVIEHFLTDRLGETGKKIHTGRSRNDQVLAALRLFLRERLQILGAGTADVASILCDWGEAHDRMLMPGYTHMQRAMPSTVGLWAMGYAELLVSDLITIESAYDQINSSPLGSAAGYGVPYLDLPRSEIAENLGFVGIQMHVTAVQLSRGKLDLHTAHAAVQVAATLNRLASDLILFNTSEFGFVRLPDKYCTGSSIMPQKKNPDVLELARASYHRILAELNVLLTLPANLPSGYHRDLQLTKEAAMRVQLHTHDLVEAMRNLLPGVIFVEERLRAATTAELYATARALDLVRQGLPFRDAYRQAAHAAENLERPDIEETLNAYLVDGFPGRSRPSHVRRLLEEISDRLQSKQVNDAAR